MNKLKLYNTLAATLAMVIFSFYIEFSIDITTVNGGETGEASHSHS